MLNSLSRVAGEGWGGGAAISHSIAFDTVAFAYPGGRRAAHQGLSFSIAAGERVGIVGPSGSGKSTIVRLLLRLHDPQSGAVRIGGHDLRALDPDAVRRMIAVVAQDTYLFHGSIEDNLRLGCPDASEAELVAVARAANAERDSRAASASASPSPARCCAMRQSWCWTRRCRRWTRRTRR